MQRDTTKKLFLDKCFNSKYQITKLPLDASFRSYERIHHGNKSYILMDAPPEHETVDSFINVGNFLYENKFSAPKILNIDEPNGFLLLEDLGDYHYSKAVNDIDEEHIYLHAIDTLITLHNTKSIIELPVYSKQKLLDEALLLVDWYFQALNGEELNNNLREEYIEIWNKLLDHIIFFDRCIVLRDYHADNIMWLEDREGHQKVGLLDFQDAVIGSIAYDVVSLLEDARRDVGKDIAEKMLNYYLEQTNHNRKEFLADYVILGAQRNCKIIGIFARKAVRDNDSRYLKMLPRVWNHIRLNLNNPLLSPLKQWLDKVSVLALRT